MKISVSASKDVVYISGRKSRTTAYAQLYPHTSNHGVRVVIDLDGTIATKAQPFLRDKFDAVPCLASSAVLIRDGAIFTVTDVGVITHAYLDNLVGATPPAVSKEPTKTLPPEPEKPFSASVASITACISPNAAVDTNVVQLSAKSVMPDIPPAVLDKPHLRPVPIKPQSLKPTPRAPDTKIAGDAAAQSELDAISKAHTAKPLKPFPSSTPRRPNPFAPQKSSYAAHTLKNRKR